MIKEYDIDNVEDKEAFNNFLNDCYNDYYVGNICFTASQVLKNCDPVAYRRTFYDWASDLENID